MANHPPASRSQPQADEWPWQWLKFTVDTKGFGHVSGGVRLNGRDHYVKLTGDLDLFRALHALPLGKLYPLLHGLSRYPTYNRLLPSQNGRKKPRGRSADSLQAWRTAREIGPALRAWAEKASGTRDLDYAAAVKRMKRGRSPSPLAVAAFLVEMDYRNAGLTWPGPSPVKDPKTFFQRLDRRKEEPASDFLYSAGFDRSCMAKSILAGKKLLVVEPAPFTIGF
jgi:hypothetical protein